eukprot:TRINITY_DN11276_c1_g3_i1.p1 TRINITY_DN11276_c1_g3~~TRINITY_DN11276_c1_g3_i1.p1  ORF type:complete len:1718 (+),score=414.81 TRINITY_DN11276_c1_g3_i1:233-5386(+)
MVGFSILVQGAPKAKGSVHDPSDSAGDTTGDAIRSNAADAADQDCQDAAIAARNRTPRKSVRGLPPGLLASLGSAAAAGSKRHSVMMPGAGEGSRKADGDDAADGPAKTPFLLPTAANDRRLSAMAGRRISAMVGSANAVTAKRASASEGDDAESATALSRRQPRKSVIGAPAALLGGTGKQQSPSGFSGSGLRIDIDDADNAMKPGLLTPGSILGGSSRRNFLGGPTSLMGGLSGPSPSAGRHATGIHIPGQSPAAAPRASLRGTPGAGAVGGSQQQPSLVRRSISGAAGRQSLFGAALALMLPPGLAEAHEKTRKKKTKNGADSDSDESSSSSDSDSDSDSDDSDSDSSESSGSSESSESSVSDSSSRSTRKSSKKSASARSDSDGASFDDAADDGAGSDASGEAVAKTGSIRFDFGRKSSGKSVASSSTKSSRKPSKDDSTRRKSSTAEGEVLSKSDEPVPGAEQPAAERTGEEGATLSRRLSQDETKLGRRLSRRLSKAERRLSKVEERRLSSQLSATEEGEEEEDAAELLETVDDRRSAKKGRRNSLKEKGLTRAGTPPVLDALGQHVMDGANLQGSRQGSKVAYYDSEDTRMNRSDAKDKEKDKHPNASFFTVRVAEEHAHMTPEEARQNALRNARAIQQIIGEIADDAHRSHEKWVKKSQNLQQALQQGSSKGPSGSNQAGMMQPLTAAEARAQNDARKAAAKLRKDRKNKIRQRLQRDMEWVKRKAPMPALKRKDASEALMGPGSLCISISSTTTDAAEAPPRWSPENDSLEESPVQLEQYAAEAAKSTSTSTSPTGRFRKGSAGSKPPAEPAQLPKKLLPLAEQQQGSLKATSPDDSENAAAEASALPPGLPRSAAEAGRENDKEEEAPAGFGITLKEHVEKMPVLPKAGVPKEPTKDSDDSKKTLRVKRGPYKLSPPSSREGPRGQSAESTVIGSLVDSDGDGFSESEEEEDEEEESTSKGRPEATCEPRFGRKNAGDDDAAASPGSDGASGDSDNDVSTSEGVQLLDEFEQALKSMKKRSSLLQGDDSAGSSPANRSGSKTSRRRKGSKTVPRQAMTALEMRQKESDTGRRGLLAGSARAASKDPTRRSSEKDDDFGRRASLSDRRTGSKGPLLHKELHPEHAAAEETTKRSSIVAPTYGATLTTEKILAEVRRGSLKRRESQGQAQAGDGPLGGSQSSAGNPPSSPGEAQAYCKSSLLMQKHDASAIAHAAGPTNTNKPAPEGHSTGTLAATTRGSPFSCALSNDVAPEPCKPTERMTLGIVRIHSGGSSKKGSSLFKARKVRRVTGISRMSRGCISALPRNEIDPQVLTNAKRQRLPEVPRLRYKMHDVSNILGGRWSECTKTLKRGLCAYADMLGLNEDDYKLEQLYKWTLPYLEGALIQRKEREQHDAARTIQDYFRRRMILYKTRMALAVRRKAAAILQEWWREISQKLSFIREALRARQKAYEHRMATRLQAVARGWLTRSLLKSKRDFHRVMWQMNNLKGRLFARHIFAIVILQAMVRGWLVRKRRRRRFQASVKKAAAMKKLFARPSTVAAAEPPSATRLESSPRRGSSRKSRLADDMPMRRARTSHIWSAAMYGDKEGSSVATTSSDKTYRRGGSLGGSKLQPLGPAIVEPVPAVAAEEENPRSCIPPGGHVCRVRPRCVVPIKPLAKPLLGLRSQRQLEASSSRLMYGLRPATRSGSTKQGAEESFQGVCPSDHGI